jgi:hypothetical protein
MKKKIIQLVFIVFFVIFSIIGYQKIFKKEKIVETEVIAKEEAAYNSNIIDNVNYVYKSDDGIEYTINAVKGEIDFTNNEIIYLTNVDALIRLKDATKINIKSEFGKYNTDNYDTIFSKNVIINYLENKINSEYLDFSIKRNSMIITKNVVYRNFENILKADVVEVDIKTKDTKIFMHDGSKKVKIKSKD